MRESTQDPQSLLARLEPGPAERRASVRYRCVRRCITRSFITNTYRTLSARVVDISAEGAGLIIAEPLPVGTWLTVELEDSATPLELLVEISNVTAQADGSWRCGCAMVWRISEDEMWMLLKNRKL